MRNIIVCIMLCLGLICYAAITETHSTGAGSSAPTYSQLKKVRIGELDDAVTSTATLRRIYGFVNRIAIIPTGTEVSYTVALRDENTVNIFSATLNAASGTQSWAVSHADTAGNDFGGVPVAGVMTLVVDNVASTTLTDLSVDIYYTEHWN